MSDRVAVTAYRYDTDEIIDITEGVQVMYDALIGSMDWGSGFLANDEAVAILRVAQACGFLSPTEAQETFNAYARDDASWDPPAPLIADGSSQAPHLQPGMAHGLMPERVRCVDCRGFVHFERGWRLATYIPSNNHPLGYTTWAKEWEDDKQIGWVHNKEADHPVRLWVD